MSTIEPMDVGNAEFKEVSSIKLVKQSYTVVESMSRTSKILHNNVLVGLAIARRLGLRSS